MIPHHLVISWAFPYLNSYISLYADFPELGLPYKKDYTIWASVLGSPYFAKRLYEPIPLSCPLDTPFLGKVISLKANNPCITSALVATSPGPKPSPLRLISLKP